MAPVAALLVATIITSLVIELSGEPAADFWGVIFSKPPSGSRVMVNIINQTSMIYISALAAAIGFRMNLFNIGVEGQYTIASYCAAAVAGAAIFPGLLNVLIPLLIAIAVGAIWAGIAGVLKVTRGVSEVISTIMLNSIAIALVRLPAATLRPARRQHGAQHPDPREQRSSTAGRRSRVRPRRSGRLRSSPCCSAWRSGS